MLSLCLFENILQCNIVLKTFLEMESIILMGEGQECVVCVQIM